MVQGLFVRRVERLKDLLELGLNSVTVELVFCWIVSILYVFLYVSSISSELDKFVSGSHVLSLDPYPFHLVRYRIVLPLRLCARIASTSYSSCPSIKSGGGLM